MKRLKCFPEELLNIRALVNAIVMVHLLLILSLGQTQTISVSIRVTDPNGAPVPGATVTIQKEGSTQVNTQTTDEGGLANFIGVEPGDYTVTAIVSGFTSTRVQVSIKSVVSLNIKLSPGVMETVVVTTSGTEDQSDALSALPNFNNDLSPILQNTVGAVATGSSALGRIILDGKGKDTTTIRLDGLDSTPQIDLPSADSWIDVSDGFQKPSVAFNSENPGTNSRAFTPQFGPGTGVVIDNVTLKADTTWRAQIYGEHLNNAFNARNYFDYFGKNGVQRTRFGGKTGGPLDKDARGLLYLAYEGIRGRTERSIFEAVPLEAVCRCGVDGVLGTLLGNYLPSGTVILPNASINSAFAVAQRRGLTSVEGNAFDVRFDQTFSQTPSTLKLLTLRYTPQSATNFVPDGITGRRQRQKLSFNNFLASFRLETEKFVNTIKFGLNSTKVRIDSENTEPLPQQLERGLVNLGGSVRTAGLTGLSSVPVATLGSLIKGIGRGFDLDPKAFSLAYDSVVQLNSRHQLFFGVEVRFIDINFDRLGGITYSFANLDAFRSGSPTSTNFLSDLSGPSPFSASLGKRRAKQNYFLSYVQFKSELSEGLNITYGLRYDYFGGLKERNDRAFLIDPESGAELPLDSSFFRTQANNFQPRFGLSYQIANGGIFESTVLKLGAGIYSGTPRIGDLLLPIESDRLNTSINGGNFSIGIDDILENFRNQPLTRQFQPLAFSRNFEIPERVYKWEASLTRTFSSIYDLVFLYTGNSGRHLPIARVGNQIVNVLTNPNPTQPAIVVRQFDILRDGQVLKPFGEFFYRASDGLSNYNAVSVQFKRNSKGGTDLPVWLNLRNLSLQYTYSLNKGNVSGSVLSNPLNVDSDYGFNSSDARHSLSFSAVYNLWEALGARQSSLLWGWRIAPIINARSGFPLIVRLDRPDVVYRDGLGNFSPTPAAGRTAVLNVPGGGASGGALVPDLLAGANPYTNNGDRLTLLNPAAFSIPQPGNFGNFRRGQLRGPGSVSFDLGVSRYLFDNDRIGSEFRVEVFNLLNRANFINPTISLPNSLGMSQDNNQIQPGTPFSRAAAGSFGIVSAADLGRRIQFSFALRFKRGFTQ